MKLRTTNWIAALATVCLLIASCSKDDDAPAAPSGGGGTGGTPSEGYIKFDLDGTTINCDQVATAATNTGIPGSRLFLGVAVTIGGVWASSWSTIIPDSLSAPITINTGQTDPIFTMLAIHSTDPQVTTDDQTYLLSTGTSGSTTFTRLDTLPGGLLEGTFSYAGVSVIDNDGTTVSTGHSITNGSFSLPLPQ
ncbi:MAG: hypothetical protein LKM36_05760 [Flavobacteriales bacterium]|jgi:hypothetical protein|nr:hypothetical protein [Flavobacteriales bacterium]